MSAPTAAATLASLDEGFEQALAAAPGELVEERFLLAGRPVRVRVVGRDLARIKLMPLERLRDPEPTGQPELEVKLWDGEASGVQLDGPFPEEMATVDDERGRVIGGYVPGALSAIDRSVPRIAGWRQSPATVMIEEYWRPVPQVLPFWYLDVGVNIIHGAMICRGDEGVLVIGPGGAGKSTTTLACVAAGLGMVGDDQVGISGCEGDYTAHMLYGVARVMEEALERFPELRTFPELGALPDNKHLIAPPPEQLIPRATVRGIVVLRTGAERDRLGEASAGETLLACAPYSLVGLVGGAGHGMAKIGGMVRTLPRLRLEVQGGPAGAVRLVEQALDELTG